MTSKKYHTKWANIENSIQLDAAKSNGPHRSVLFITVSFPPVCSPRSIRCLYFVNHLVQSGFKVDVVTLNLQGGISRVDIDLCNKLNPMVRLYRIPSHVRALLIKPNTGQGATRYKGIVHRILYPRALRVGKSIIRKLAFPDPFIFDVPWVLKEVLRRMCRYHYDFIVTSAHPVSTYFLGWIVKLKSPSTKWVMDLGDPWAFNEELVWGRGILRILTLFIEKIFLSRVDGLVVTNPQIRDLYSAIFGLSRESICVIPQGVDVKIYDKIIQARNERGNSGDPQCIRFVYTGIFYDRIREPAVLYQALQLLPNEIKRKICFDFYGYIPKKFTSDISDDMGRRIVNFHGNVSHLSAIRAQCYADILVLFGNKGRLQIPGKLYEYIVARKPILYISQAQADTVANLIRDCRIGEVAQADPISIHTAIKKLVSYYENSALDNQYRMFQDIVSLSWEARANKFIHFLKGLL